MNVEIREPWRIPASAFDAMVARAEADYPDETCGLVFGSGDALEVVPLRNTQNDLHKADPQQNDRTARTAYAFDPSELVRAINSREAQGIALRAIYHSHPDHDAYFSETDRNAAAPPEWGEPTYPGTEYIVFSIRQGKLRATAGFSWSETKRDFVEFGVERGD